MKYLTMRDAFFNRLYEMAKSDKDIVVVTADLGAPTLDKFRRDFPRQFINVGISEQNAILVAVGLALRHKKPIAYAITQFITQMVISNRWKFKIILKQRIWRRFKKVQ